MLRRHYLAGSGSLLVATLAGCSSDEEDDDETPTPTETDETGTDEPETDEDDASTESPQEPEFDEDEAMDALRAELEAANVQISELMYDPPDWIVLDYTTEAEESDEVEDDVVDISRALAAAIDPFEDEALTMECWALSEDDDSFVAGFEIDLDWARTYAAGDLSDEEYTQKILETVE